MRTSYRIRLSEAAQAFAVPALLTALLLTGCSDLITNAQPVPDSTMVKVLTGIHLSQARSRLYGDLPPAPTDSVLLQHHLKRSTFERALDYYTNHPKTYMAVYDSVVTRLDEQRRPRERDSLTR